MTKISILTWIFSHWPLVRSGAKRFTIQLTIIFVIDCFIRVRDSLNLEYKLTHDSNRCETATISAQKFSVIYFFARTKKRHSFWWYTYGMICNKVQVWTPQVTWHRIHQNHKHLFSIDTNRFPGSNQLPLSRRTSVTFACSRAVVLIFCLLRRR